MLTVFWFFLGSMGCTGTNNVNEDPMATQPLPPVLSNPAIQFRPAVAFLPENGSTVRILFDESMELGGHDFDVTDVEGKSREGTMTRWIWDEPRRKVRFELQGLKAGERFVLSARGLVADSGERVSDFSKTYVVRPADTTPPEGNRLILDGSPSPLGNEPLVLVFNEPVRWTSINALNVLAGGDEVEGVWTLGPHQTRATFEARKPWNDAQVYVAVGAGVSDLAGNAMVNLPQAMLVAKGKTVTP